MTPLTTTERWLAETAARVIVKAEESGLSDAPQQLAAPATLRCLARVHVELCDQISALIVLGRQAAPGDPLCAALAKVGLLPQDARLTAHAAVTTAATASTERLAELYRHVDGRAHLDKHPTFVVRQWDGMDGCWTDCTGEVTRAEALRVWAKYTADGTRNIAYAEITYYGIFPGGTRMHWDGTDGREMHRR